MKYKIDITNSYEYFIDIDGWSGVKNYCSLPKIDQKNLTCRIYLENASIRMDENIWRDQILLINPKSIINIADDLLVLARKATLTIENIRCYDLKVIHKERDYYHSSGLNFNIKDRYIVLGGYDSEHLDSNIFGRAIFQGKVFLELEEDKILPLMIDGDDGVVGGDKGIIKINNEKETELIKKRISLNISYFNAIESPMWDYNFTSNYFNDMDGYKEAILDYPPSQNN
ncbi:hypothetical protein A9G41_06300 [Gilliamella sp. Nev5-1]|uniref:hypothetical protein n=1 Tax=unclassified Gilliamella TaxID=2685620 RepID=UPI00080D9751|nr:hypothetical protein [Gilliamella apicola]OCG58027.1 hypothetical protein A9G40_00585 [Gilliamella apicola]OCG67866.1 hypothetical protein A9G41_09030 [Gilliamella apicola]OCG69482.1 hypothetical protein A9G41_06300 [Gilliamella apicola]